MVFLAVILGLGAGLGVVIMLEAMSAAVFGAAEVTALTGIAPLAIIGYMETQEEEGHHNRKRYFDSLGFVMHRPFSHAAVPSFCQAIRCDLVYLIKKIRYLANL